MLAAIAGCTRRIRLGAAVTVLSSDDPLRVFHLKCSARPLPHEKLMRSIELYGKTIIPLVRNLLSAT